MAQAGIHALVGAAVRKWTPAKEWLMLGIVLGNIFPDMDNLAVAVATVAKLSKDGLHRTATHSIFFVLAIILIGWLIGFFSKQPKWANLGLGFGIGVLMHILLDLLLWFNGVALLWPLPLWINFWENARAPEWFMTLMDPFEFLMMGLFLSALGAIARKHNTDRDFMKTLNIWMWVLFILFFIFTPLAYIMTAGFLTIFGALYLVMLIATFFITIRMRQTVEAVG